jgi:RNA polymerase sigma-70 factor (ECF subfamily)
MPVSEGTNSFGAVVPPHVPAMLRLAAALIGPADAEDAVQEASMRAWQSWSRLRSVDSVRPWLLQITLNVCRQWRRGLKGREQSHLLPLPEDSDTQHHELAMLESDPGTSNHTGALDLRAAINALPTDLRLVVVLRFYTGLDASEIGETLSIPAGTVRSRLHRALLQMRERLQPQSPSFVHTPRSDMEGRS